MKRASRFMSKPIRNPPSLLAWTFLIAPALWLLYLLWRYPLATAAYIAVVAVLSWLHRWSIRNHLQAIAASRDGESICTFARAADCRSMDTWIVRAVYEEVQESLASECSRFPIRWTDRLKEDLCIDPDALDEELAIDIAKRIGRDIRSTETNPLFGKVETVRDLVLFFHAQPKRAEEPQQVSAADVRRRT
jgi:hypothetical protein